MWGILLKVPGAVVVVNHSTSAGSLSSRSSAKRVFLVNNFLTVEVTGEKYFFMCSTDYFNHNALMFH